jgi:DNA repair protein RadA/Sms
VARRQTVFTCSQCGHQEHRWLGRCPDCASWNSFVEEVVVHTTGSGTRQRARVAGSGPRDGAAGYASAVALADVASSTHTRFSSGIDELDRVLGGGVVPGSVVLVGGEPGIGKSTLLLQALDAVAAGRRVLLVCGEESPAQVKMRAERVAAEPAAIRVLAETELEAVLAAAEAEQPELLVVDSVQTLFCDELSSAPGSVSQVREAAGRLQRLAKASGMAVFLVGHVTKDGSLAGPRVLEHMVDTVLQFEGDRDRFYRVLRATKNRFGSTNEIGVFEMGAHGLTGVADPSHLFLSDREPGPGSCIHVAVEGSRCFLVEVQALVNPSELAVPRRLASGFDRNRLAMIVAVLGRHARLALSAADVFVNIAGGIRMEEPAADLAVALAIASAERRLPLQSSSAVFGEISLTGEIRSSSQPERRVAEAARTGFVTVLVPGRDKRRALAGEPSAVGVADVGAALSRAFGSNNGNHGRQGNQTTGQGV